MMKLIMLLDELEQKHIHMVAQSHFVIIAIMFKIINFNHLIDFFSEFHSYLQSSFSSICFKIFLLNICGVSPTT